MTREERLSVAFCGYHNMPAAWIGALPDFQRTDTTELFNTEVEYTFTNGCRGKVLRCGIVQFDFSAWSEGAAVTIPASDDIPGSRASKAFQAADDLAIIRMYNRVEAMNAHIGCVAASKVLIARTGQISGNLIYASDYLPFPSFESHSSNAGLSPSSPMHAAVIAAWNRDRARRWPILSHEVMRHSFDMLDKLFQISEFNAVRLCALLYRANWHYAQHEFSNCLMIGWTAIEAMLNVMWQRLIEEKRSQGLVVTADHKKKLTGSEYTASKIADALYLAGKMEKELFDRTSEARSARNSWVHRLEDVDANTATRCVMTGLDHFTNLTGIKFLLSMGYSLRY
jgi:hypothetical protein